MKKLISLILIIIVLSSSTAFALSDKEIHRYINKNYPIIKEENIKVHPVTMIYVNWDALYAINKIQINKIHVVSYRMLDIVLQHELVHHYCWKERKNIDIEHKLCF